MGAEKVKLTKAAIEGLEPPTEGERIVRDAELMGFAVRITASGARSYIVEKKIAGRTKRITLARCDLLTVKAAREEAIQALGKMAKGEVPSPRVVPVASPPVPVSTLGDVLEHYLKERQRRVPPMKPRTVQSYRKLMQGFGEWVDRPPAAMSQQDVVDLHAALTKRGPTYANNVMRTARAIFNHAIDNDAFFGEGGGPALLLNPLVVLRKRRLWNRETRRTRRLDATTLPIWWKMVEGLDPLDWPERADVVRDMWKLMLFTGMRYEEAGRILVDLVDLERGTFVVKDTKNREDLELPVGNYVLGLLTTRVKESKRARSPWLFPAPKRAAGHTAAGHDIRKVLQVATKLHWSNHDLRRTFASILESFDLSDATIKRLMGHKQRDVTAGYIQHDIERLRGVMQRYETHVLGLVGATPPHAST